MKNTGLIVSGRAIVAATLAGVSGFGLTGCAPGVSDAANNSTLLAVTKSAVFPAPSVTSAPSIAAPIETAVTVADEAAKKLLAYNLCVSKIPANHSYTEKWFSPAPFENAQIVKRNDGGYFVGMVYTNLVLTDQPKSMAFCYILGDLAHPEFPSYGSTGFENWGDYDPNVVPFGQE